MISRSVQRISKRAFSAQAKKPMTRFIQYPFDKTKMVEVRAFLNENKAFKAVRNVPGVKSLEFSFCPGQGWVAARFIYEDLEDMKKYLNQDFPEFQAAATALKANEHYDNSREIHEFKGFYLEEM